jgi:hypothetical protein
MKPKIEFRFELGDKVFILGTPGICIVSARGRMNFLSGGTLIMYQIEGAHCGYFAEHTLISEQDTRKGYDEH